MQPIWTARAVIEEFVLVVILVSLPMIIPCAKRVDTISAEDVIAYNEGITGSHFGVGGIDRIMIPLQVSSDIVDVVRATARLNLIRSSRRS